MFLFGSTVRRSSPAADSIGRPSALAPTRHSSAAAIRGAVRVDEGLWLGDGACHNEDWLSDKRVTRVVNCGSWSAQLKERFETVEYFPMASFADHASGAGHFEEEDGRLMEMAEWVMEGLRQGEGVLVGSQLGRSEAVAAMVAVIMIKNKKPLSSAIAHVRRAVEAKDGAIFFLSEGCEQRLRGFISRQVKKGLSGAFNLTPSEKSNTSETQQAAESAHLAPLRSHRVMFGVHNSISDDLQDGYTMMPSSASPFATESEGVGGGLSNPPTQRGDIVRQQGPSAYDSRCRQSTQDDTTVAEPLPMPEYRPEPWTLARFFCEFCTASVLFCGALEEPTTLDSHDLVFDRRPSIDPVGVGDSDRPVGHDQEDEEGSGLVDEAKPLLTPTREGTRGGLFADDDI
ncbi:unnamed protein product [Vitrella brassicaformis CCMP3155]|uniref:Tyrosine-protein phosphatase domain-containing protein n=1 Tax=Vitrella brassicaformis (strain CCMP3155) TaxID=1169540 RepID=A0A0G4ERD9_VITBC|nr:unnamed protein product [Vitrella brassicaformis CCMP3155]|eukprot:CEL99999.1 unnamed protein product [Vitrella brassicaformis CCMP3155]